MNRAKAIKYFEQGVEYYEKSQFELALECFNQAIKLNPKLAEAYSYKAIIYKELKQYKESLDNFNQVIKVNSKDPVSYYNRGLFFYTLREYTRAINDYNQALKLNPNMAIAYNNRGEIYSIQRDFTKALDDFEKAIYLEPENANSYNNKGNVFYKLKQYDLALSCYTQAINYSQTFIVAYNNRGLVYEKLGNIEKALENYNQAIYLNPSYVDVYNNKGLLYYNLNNYQEALLVFNIGIDLQKKAELYYNRGLLFVITKQFDLAKKDLDSSIELTEHKDIKILSLSLSYSIFLAEQQFELAEYYAHKIFEFSENLEEIHKRIYLDNIEKAKEIYQKNQELEKAYLLLKEDYKAEIEENRRFKYLSATASDIAHQINQPIGAMRLEITGARQRIIDGKFKPERINPLLERVFEQLERLNNIITQFRSYANGNIECNIMNLNDIITKTIAVFNTQSEGHSIQLIPVLTNPSPNALVNAFLLQEILLNLLNNAKDALENIDNSTIWIKTWQTSDGRNGIDIEDNGTGVSPKILETLFLPFSTTKTAQKGLGLGLFIARTKVEKFGGQLTYKPRENGGSCFSICFLNTSKKELEHEQTI